MPYKFNIEKQPEEIIPVAVDFAADLASSETITGTDVKAYDKDNVDVSGTILSGAAQIQNGDQTSSVIAQKVQAGTSGEEYKITFQATTSAIHVFEADVVMVVNEL